jgi:hypothetical protein
MRHTAAGIFTSRLRKCCIENEKELYSERESREDDGGSHAGTDHWLEAPQLTRRRMGDIMGDIDMGPWVASCPELT